jgi:hypothetical protein
MSNCDFSLLMNVPDLVFQQYGISLVILERVHWGSGSVRYKLNYDSATQALVGTIVAGARGVTNIAAKNELGAIGKEVIERWAKFHAFFHSRRRHQASLSKTSKEGKPYFDVHLYFSSQDLHGDVIEFFGDREESHAAT